MKDIYFFIRNYLLNGIFGYALLGFYALTVSPFVTRFIDYGEKSLFVFFFGMTMLILEFFAFRFKLIMIRLRAEEKRLAYKKLTGIDIIPRPGKLVLFGLFTRMLFRIGVIMISLTAIGIPCTEKNMSNAGSIILLVCFFIDMYGLILTYEQSQIYTDPPENEKQQEQNEKDNEEWNKISLPLAHSSGSYWKELLADVILQVYTVMLFTAFWSYLNEIGIGAILHGAHVLVPGIITFLEVFPLLFIILFLGLMPIRIAYWIEDSIMAFTWKEKVAMWIVFFVVCFFTCFPSILIFCSFYLFNDHRFLASFPYFYINLLLVSIFLLILICLRLWLAREKMQVAVSTIET